MVIFVSGISTLFILQLRKINFQHQQQPVLGYILNENNEPVNQFCAFPILWQGEAAVYSFTDWKCYADTLMQCPFEHEIIVAFACMGRCIVLSAL